jgi:hypothetical protein
VNCPCDKCTQKYGAQQREGSSGERDDNDTGAHVEPEAEEREGGPTELEQEALVYGDIEANSGGLVIQGNDDYTSHSQRAKETTGLGIQPTSSEPPKVSFIDSSRVSLSTNMSIEVEAILLGGNRPIRQAGQSFD